MSATTGIRLPRYDVSRHAAEGGYANAARNGGGASAARARSGQREPGGKWAREIDPAGTMDPAELAKRLRARLMQQIERMNIARRAKAAARKASQPTPLTAALATVCSWCHPRVAGKTHAACARHERTYDAMVAEVRARHAGNVA